MTAAVVLIVQRRIIRAFADAGAWAPDTARTTYELGVRESWLFQRLVARGVLRRVGGDRYHLDTDGLRRYRARLNVLRVIVVVVLIIGVAMLLLF